MQVLPDMLLVCLRDWRALLVRQLLVRLVPALLDCILECDCCNLAQLCGLVLLVCAVEQRRAATLVLLRLHQSVQVGRDISCTDLSIGLHSETWPFIERI